MILIIVVSLETTCIYQWHFQVFAINNMAACNNSYLVSCKMGANDEKSLLRTGNLLYNHQTKIRNQIEEKQKTSTERLKVSWFHFVTNKPHTKDWPSRWIGHGMHVFALLFSSESRNKYNKFWSSIVFRRVASTIKPLNGKYQENLI